MHKILWCGLTTVACNILLRRIPSRNNLVHSIGEYVYVCIFVVQALGGEVSLYVYIQLQNLADSPQRLILYSQIQLAVD